MSTVKDMTGLRFGRLVVQGFSECTKNGWRWRCICDCGNQRDVFGKSLRRGATQSCGCLNAEATTERSTTHGNNRIANGCKPTPEYYAWKGIKARTLNPKSQYYADYGGRGIKMHKPWEDSFEAFLKDVGQRPEGKNSIGRIDVNGHYEPGNVRWESWMEQGMSLRRNVWLNLGGYRVHLSQAARILGVANDTAKKRLLLWDQ